MLKGTQAYVQTKYTTLGQGEILIMLYDGALQFLDRAKQKMAVNDYAAKGVFITKAMDIIHELDSSLNMEVGGQLAENLHQLYFLCSTRLLQANLRMDPTLIDSVMDILSGLRDAYAQIIKTPEAQAASAQITARLSPASSSLQKAAPIPTTLAPTGASKSTARSAYTQAATMSPVDMPAAGEPVAQEPITAPMPAAPVTAFASTLDTAALEDATPLDQPAPAPVNVANRRLMATARYGKISQGM